MQNYLQHIIIKTETVIVRSVYIVLTNSVELEDQTRRCSSVTERLSSVQEAWVQIPSTSKQKQIQKPYKKMPKLVYFQTKAC